MAKRYGVLNNWQGSCLSSETTVHQISPYIGKMKSLMAKSLIRAFSKRGDVILDPFVGSGTIALEALIAGRNIIGVDINPYAIALTKAKIFVPGSLSEAVKKAEFSIKLAEKRKVRISLKEVPLWVRQFYNRKTLKEIVALVSILKKRKDHFTLACLLGILHHQRPGFLSYPSSHLVPYLRTRKFPREQFSKMYEYRAVAPRLIAKIQRVYKRPVSIDCGLMRKCIELEFPKVKLEKNYVDAIITSPPYMNALSYGRDNRLRLWFLGCNRYQEYDEKTNSKDKFAKLIKDSFSLFYDCLKDRGVCVLVIGQIRGSKSSFNIGKFIVDLVQREVKGFKFVRIIEDSIPNIRRARRDCRGTKKEWVVVFEKTSI